MNRSSTENFQSSENTLHDIIMIDTCYYILSKPVQYTEPRVNPNVNSGLWVVMMYQCRFITCKICTSLVGNIYHWGGYAYVGVYVGRWEISVLSTQFCCELKTTHTK